MASGLVSRLVSSLNRIVLFFPNRACLWDLAIRKGKAEID